MKHDTPALVKVGSDRHLSCWRRLLGDIVTNTTITTEWWLIPISNSHISGESFLFFNPYFCSFWFRRIWRG